MTKVAAVWEEAVALVLAGLRHSGDLGEATVVLIGSMVRDKATEKSDIDILIVTPATLARIEAGPRAQISRMTRAAFLH